MERSAQAESDRLSYSLSAWDYCIHSMSESSLAPVFSIVILITTFCDKQQKLWIKYVKRYYSLDTFQNRGILLECLKKKKRKFDKWLVYFACVTGVLQPIYTTAGERR